MNRTHKTKAIGIASCCHKSIWRRVIKQFRDDHNPLLAASLTVFNFPRIYLLQDFNSPLRLILSRL